MFYLLLLFPRQISGSFIIIGFKEQNISLYYEMEAQGSAVELPQAGAGGSL
jgi:hypothetical protein